MMRLVSVACLALAAKMEETEVPLIMDLQVKILSMIFTLLFCTGFSVFLFSDTCLRL